MSGCSISYYHYTVLSHACQGLLLHPLKKRAFFKGQGQSLFLPPLQDREDFFRDLPQKGVSDLSYIPVRLFADNGGLLRGIMKNLTETAPIPTHNSSDRKEKQPGSEMETGWIFI